MAARQYAGAEITVLFDAHRCRHFAECVRGLPAVFDVSKRPWIQADNADAELVAEVVRRCPSGALHYLNADGEAEQPTHPTEIEAVPNGPLAIRGELVIATDCGPVSETRATLCRCGLTANSPFCDDQCELSEWRSPS